ncbi:MAG: NADH:flavin oxidoreductase [Actinomycetia bacterium]|nr:NADH:flavin oxidoreductase [Actinomycetes bacterium]
MVGSPYPHLLAPGRIGTLELRNRIVMCPMGDRLANPDGTVSDAHLAYFERRAEGGAGLLLLGSVAVSYPEGAYALEQLGIAGDGHLPGYAALAERVHAHGAKVAAQLVHNGATSVNDMAAGRPLLVPSVPHAVQRDRLSGMLTAEEVAAMSRSSSQATFAVRYREATEDDCEALIDAFASAAERCVAAGLDGVELHAGHGYLIDEFLSPASNHRTDRWGGPIENRARLLCEVVREVRRRLGADVPLWARINAFEAHQPGGTTLDDAIAAARLGVAAGLDAVHVSAYASGGVATGMTDSHTPHQPGAMVPFAAAVRAAVDVPVITMGRLDPAAAEAAIAGGATDFVAMGRKLLADPDLPEKLRTGHQADVRPCIYQYRCIGNISVGKGVRCVVNPGTGREHELPPPASGPGRRILVVGGGPAGLEAARLLRADGHQVSLWEAGPALGGQLALGAAVDPPLADLLAWLVRQVAGLGVEVVTGVAATVERCLAGGFSSVVVATGSAPSWPADGVTVRRADDLGPWLAAGGDDVGARVVVVGGDRGGLALARHCAEAGRHVTVLEGSTVFAADMGLPGRFRTVHDTEQAGVVLVGGAEVTAIDDDGVHLVVAGASSVLPADTVLLVQPREARATLLQELLAAGVDARGVGECVGAVGLEGAFAGVGALVPALRDPVPVSLGGGGPRS